MDQAKQELNGTGLGIRQAGTASSDTVEKGQIISQDPADGKTVERIQRSKLSSAADLPPEPVRIRSKYQTLWDRVKLMPVRH